MLNKLALLAVAGVVSFSSNAQSQPSVPAPSLWRNQVQSTLRIRSIAADGSFKGTYINREKTTSCKYTSYPAAGKISGNSIFFGVDFAACDTIASWHGTVQGTTITTSWQYYYIAPDTGNFVSVNGNDTFTRVH